IRDSSRQSSASAWHRKAYAIFGLSVLTDYFTCSIRALIVDDNDFPRNRQPGKCSYGAVEQNFDICDLINRRHNERKCLVCRIHLTPNRRSSVIVDDLRPPSISEDNIALSCGVRTISAIVYRPVTISA